MFHTLPLPSINQFSPPPTTYRKSQITCFPSLIAFCPSPLASSSSSSSTSTSLTILFLLSGAFPIFTCSTLSFLLVLVLVLLVLLSDLLLVLSASRRVSASLKPTWFGTRGCSVCADIFWVARLRSLGLIGCGMLCFDGGREEVLLVFAGGRGGIARLWLRLSIGIFLCLPISVQQFLASAGWEEDSVVLVLS
ncbi:hypothetical protein DL95DRAFT_394777 [Leptodontidium sp. 2 PMI_412]|nr:hypothetical protein DL95DRAFT_394777 [Leptodontidium sp. 2 PMI_412]